MSPLLPTQLVGRRNNRPAWKDLGPLAACFLTLLTCLGLTEPQLDQKAAPETPESTQEAEIAQWPRLSLCLQDKFLKRDLTGLDVRNDAWCISQHALGTPGHLPDHVKNDDEALRREIQKFIDMPVSEIRTAFGRYLANHPQLSRATTRTIIIDIERPVHPRNLWKLMDGPDHDQITPIFSDLVQAFARRFRVVRDHFPNAQLSVFGIGMPDSQGRSQGKYQARLNAEIIATKMGLLEDVNAISPALYERFGPSDRAFKKRDQATIECLRNALTITQASDRPLDILILLSLSIFNGMADENKKAADLGGIAERLDLLGKMGVKRVIFWNGDETITKTGIGVVERLTQLRALERSREHDRTLSNSEQENPAQEKAD